MISAPATELQGRDLIFQSMLLDPCCFLHSSGTRPVYCQQHFTGPSAATLEWEETTYNGLITKQEQKTLEQGKECVEDKLCFISAWSHKVGDMTAVSSYEVKGKFVIKMAQKR